MGPKVHDFRWKSCNYFVVAPKRRSEHDMEIMGNLLREGVDLSIIASEFSIPLEEVKAFVARHQPA